MYFLHYFLTDKVRVFTHKKSYTKSTPFLIRSSRRKRKPIPETNLANLITLPVFRKQSDRNSAISSARSIEKSADVDLNSGAIKFSACQLLAPPIKFCIYSRVYRERRPVNN